MSRSTAFAVGLFLTFTSSGFPKPAIAEDVPPSKHTEKAPDLRGVFLTQSPRNLGIVPTQEHPRVWAVLMDMGYAEGSATLLAAVDGTVSIYTSMGGGIIGAGEHPSVRQQAMKFISTAEQLLDEFQRTTEYPRPAPGRTRFYLRTFSGTFTGDFDEHALSEGHHKLSKLYAAGQDVISEIRRKAPSL